MRSDDDVLGVFSLWAEGLSKSEIARRSGVSRAQVRSWLRTGEENVLRSPMRTARGDYLGPCEEGAECRAVREVDQVAYAYLLGQYLGDGCLSEGPRAPFKLRITACDAYPGIMRECEEAMRAVRPASRVGRTQRVGCTELYSFSRHWICFFPQHGRGRKHLRPIVLPPWQEWIALDRHPAEFLRGLVHSDGCRSTNRVTTKSKTGRKEYAYPRYFFTNASADIRGLFAEACRRLDIEPRYTNCRNLSVARNEQVARLDSFIGPKW